MQDLFIWILVSFGSVVSLKWIWRDWEIRSLIEGGTRRCRELKELEGEFSELKEILISGTAPEISRWEKFKSLAHPWGALSQKTLHDLRSSGARLIPTLERLISMTAAEREALINARTHSASAYFQAWACLTLIPGLSVAFYNLIPGLERRYLLWCGISAGAFSLSLLGSLWIFALAQNVRRGGFEKSEEELIPWLLALSERLIALVRSGESVEVAWKHCHQALESAGVSLHWAWGASLWDSERETFGDPGASAAARIQIQAPLAKLKKTVVRLLEEGRPVLERVESFSEEVAFQFRSGIEKELKILPHQALKPLFICVTPSLFGLLASGLYLCWQDLM